MQELNLQKPAAYAYDQIILALVTLATALLGVPFPNAAIPQCPMHTNALATMQSMMSMSKRGEVGVLQCFFFHYFEIRISIRWSGTEPRREKKCPILI